MSNCFGGVDVGQDKFFPCIIDIDNRKIHYPDSPAALCESDCVKWLTVFKPLFIAIDAPPRPSKPASHGCKAA